MKLRTLLMGAIATTALAPVVLADGHEGERGRDGEPPRGGQPLRTHVYACEDERDEKN